MLCSVDVYITPQLYFFFLQVGTQIYNIQLMENQKKEFVEIMAKMPARAQHEFVVQQTNIILQNVFVRQQQQAQQQQAAGGLQPQPTTPKPQNTSRSRPGRGMYELEVLKFALCLSVIPKCKV